MSGHAPASAPSIVPFHPALSLSFSRTGSRTTKESETSEADAPASWTRGDCFVFRTTVHPNSFIPSSGFPHDATLRIKMIIKRTAHPSSVDLNHLQLALRCANEETRRQQSVLNRQEKGREKSFGGWVREELVDWRPFFTSTTAIGLTQHVVHKNHWKTENLFDKIASRPIVALLSSGIDGK